MIAKVPIELNLAGVYMPPILFTVLIGFSLAGVVAHFLNYFNLARYFYFPPIAFIAMGIIFTILVGKVLPF